MARRHQTLGMIRHLLGVVVVVSLLIPQGVALSTLEVQTVVDPEVEAILRQMGPEDRIGQLFIVTFYGHEIGPGSDIATLITRYRIGGVVFMASNDNFTTEPSLPEQVYQLTTNLQSLAAGRQQPPLEDVSGPPLNATPYIPLLIGIEHEGSGGSYVPLNADITPLPSNMAIGATWNPANAEAIGEVVGRELAAMGVNLLLGPPADVAEVPQPFTTGDLGTRVFGGESFWVSQMTAAYVRGVHVGSNGRVAVFPGHFPGHGGADRLAAVEIPTVRRSLDQLTQVDLKPFFAVTGDASDPLAQADGVMTGHIRYLGFQGDNPRLATLPVSLDPQALQVLLRQDPIARWRAEGGLVVTDALGQRGVRRFYDPQEAFFYNRRIALDAFLAGNDLLYLGNFGSNPPVDQMATIVDTIDFFVQQYKEEPAFQSQVDAVVRRILRLKLDLYGGFTLTEVLPPSDQLLAIAQQSDMALSIAQSALTLLSPNQLTASLAPQAGDRIVIFTDARTTRQCSTCPPQALVPIDALQSAILRQYGPEAVGLVSLANIQSFSFEQLVSYLEFGAQPSAPAEATAPPNELAIALDSADWVVFVMLDVTASVPASDAVKRFLANPPVRSNTQIVVMAMGAPYYLDSTEVSKLTAYYALYGYTRPFIDVAARALFQGASLPGASPVSISAIDYEILAATSPDRSQVISISYRVERAGVPENSITPPGEPQPQLQDTLWLTTGVILDQNGNPVPDGTPVEFVLSYINEGLRDTQAVTTVAGVASTNLVLVRPGELHITATSPPASNSDTVQLSIPDTGPGSVTVVRPEVTPTETPVPTETDEPETEDVLRLTPTPQPGTSGVGSTRNVDFGDLYLALFGLIAISLVVFTYGFRGHDINQGLLLALPTFVSGLLGYNYYALLLPGVATWRALMGEGWAAGVATWVAAGAGLGLSLIGLRTWVRWAGIPSRGRGHR